MNLDTHVHIGTSGWHYKHWKGPFYPETLPAKRFLPYYAERLQTAEINNSFYRLPTSDTFRSWHDSVPDGFVFAVKANRYITHMKKLKDPQDPLSRFYDRVEALGTKLGPILFQLPPRWHFNPDRLQTFLQALSASHRHAFEFRDPTWLDERAYAMLSEYQVAFCIYELAGFASPFVVTTDFVYVRLHGPGGPYQGRYDEQRLREWVDRFECWAGEGREVYCYFDNDEAGYAVQNAIETAALLQF